MSLNSFSKLARVIGERSILSRIPKRSPTGFPVFPAVFAESGPGIDCPNGYIRTRFFLYNPRYKGVFHV